MAMKQWGLGLIRVIILDASENSASWKGLDQVWTKAKAVILKIHKYQNWL
jgi:hypothetical protein